MLIVVCDALWGDSQAFFVPKTEWDTTVVPLFFLPPAEGDQNYGPSRAGASGGFRFLPSPFTAYRFLALFQRIACEGRERCLLARLHPAFTPSCGAQTWGELK